jgi:hypothetical protein
MVELQNSVLEIEYMFLRTSETSFEGHAETLATGLPTLNLLRAKIKSTATDGSMSSLQMAEFDREEIE